MLPHTPDNFMPQSRDKRELCLHVYLIAGDQIISAGTRAIASKRSIITQ